MTPGNFTLEEDYCIFMRLIAQPPERIYLIHSSRELASFFPPGLGTINVTDPYAMLWGSGMNKATVG